MGVKRTIVAVENPALSNEAIQLIEGAGFKRMGEKWINYDVELHVIQELTNSLHDLDLHLIGVDQWSRVAKDFVTSYELSQGYKCSLGCCLNLAPNMKCLKEL